MGGIASLDNVLFDLDGTLVDSRGTITASIEHALGRMGVSPAAGPAVTGMIGLPLFDIFTGTFGLPREDALQAIEHYRRHYDNLSPEGSRVYEHVAQDLGRLRRHGLRLFVATVKPTSIAEKVLGDGGAGHYAACVRRTKELNPETAVEALTPDFLGVLAATEFRKQNDGDDRHADRDEDQDFSHRIAFRSGRPRFRKSAPMAGRR